MLPREKLPPPLGDCIGRPMGLLPYAYPVERSYSTQTTMKRTHFPRRFDKSDLNFQKVDTHSQCSYHIRIQSEITIHIRTALGLSFIFQHPKKPAKYINDSQTARSHLISQNVFLNLFCQLANARTAKNY